VYGNKTRALPGTLTHTVMIVQKPQQAVHIGPEVQNPVVDALGIAQNPRERKRSVQMPYKNTEEKRKKRKKAMSKTINILITIDTDSVTKSFPNPNPGTNPIGSQSNPIGIAHSMGFMVATGCPVNSGQGTGDLSIAALVGDTVRAFATSGSDNFEAAVLLYSMPPMPNNPTVFGPFNYQNFNKSTVIPNSVTSPLPAQIVTETFWFYQASVVTTGTENYEVQFTLYTRDPNTGQPLLYGYFYWDPQITVAG
jgi:hypothetical protein